MAELIQFDAAYRAIMVAKNVDEVKEIRDKAEALRLYVKQQGGGLEMQNACAEIRLRAERKAGELLKEMPKNKGMNGTVVTGDTMSPVKDDTPTLADIGITKKQSSRFQTVASIPEEVFETQIAKTKAAKKELTTKQVVTGAKKEEQRRKRQERAKAVDRLQPTARIEAILANIHQGDFREVCKEQVTDDFVDAIITDPPYPEEYLPLFEPLAREAARILKPGGSLLVMCGQSYLPQIFALMSLHLAYHWTLSYLTPGGQSPQIWPRKINTFWKPVLWFVKGEYQGDWHGDVIKSDVNDNDKRFHNWGQSESGMRRLVESFSQPGDMILDPFLGGGTTGLAAIEAGRGFIGIDTDPESIRTTKERLFELLQEDSGE